MNRKNWRTLITRARLNHQLGLSRLTACRFWESPMSDKIKGWQQCGVRKILETTNRKPDHSYWNLALGLSLAWLPCRRLREQPMNGRTLSRTFWHQPIISRLRPHRPHRSDRTRLQIPVFTRERSVGTPKSVFTPH